MPTRKDILILLAVWIQAIQNTEMQESSSAREAISTVALTERTRQVDAATVIAVPRCFVPIAAANVWAATLSLAADEGRSNVKKKIFF